MRMVSKVSFLILLAAVLIFSGLCQGQAFAERAESIVVDGYGAAPEKGKNPGQKKLMARMAAIVDGYWNIARVVEEVFVSGETTVKDCVTEDHEVYLAVDSFIKGAKIIDEEELGYGIYRVTMELSLGGEGGLIPTLKERVEDVVIEEPPRAPAPKQHTGIQLTVKMRGINPVAKIYVNKQEILKFTKSAQYIYYDYTKIYDDSDEHEITLETQTYGYKNYVIFKKKDGEVLLEKKLTAHAGQFSEYVCIAEFDYWSLECYNTNPFGFERNIEE